MSKYEKLDLKAIDWQQLLPTLGVNANVLTGKHGPCPIENYEGKDRFRWDVKKSMFHCNRCGHGDGVKLVALLNNTDYLGAIKIIRGDTENVRRVIPPLREVPKEPDPSWLRAKLKTLWETAVPIKGTPAALYLQRRVYGLDIERLSGNLRYHPDVEYWQGKKRTYRPALIARATDRIGVPVTLHRTYITPDGYKATVEDVRKLMKSHRPLAGAGIALNRPTVPSNSLIVCEGIETGLALATACGNNKEVWSMISAGNLSNADIPDRFKNVLIAADRDFYDEYNGYRPGEHFAEILATKLRDRGVHVVMRVPRNDGEDYCDLWQQKTNPHLRRVV